MNDLQIKYFQDVKNTGSFTQAAERSFVQQPTISAAIRQLEKELGFQLFNRGRGNVTLTEAGQIFDKWLNETVQSYEKMSDRARNAAIKENHSLRIGVLSYFPYSPLSEAIAITKAQNPQAQITATVIGPHELLSMISEKKADVVFCEESLVHGISALTFTPLGTTDWVIIYSKYGKYGQIHNLSLENFSDAVFIGPGSVMANQQSLSALNKYIFKSGTQQLVRVLPAINAEDALFQIQSDIGVGFCAKGYAELYPETTSYVETDIKEVFGIASPKHDRNSMTSLFLKNLYYCVQKNDFLQADRRQKQ